MGLASFYGSPENLDEEAAIWGLVLGEPLLSRVADSLVADQEAEHMASREYDDLQEVSDESLLEEDSTIDAQLSRLSVHQRGAILEIIQTMLNEG